MLMTEYETTVVVRPDVTGEQVEAALDRVRDVIGKQGGKLLEIEHWGKKKLAYPMKKHPRAIYVRTHYLGIGGLVGELERNLRLNENVLRFLTIKIDERVEADSKVEKEYVAPSYDEPDEVEEEELDASYDDHDDDRDDDRRGDRDYDRRGDRDYDRRGDRDDDRREARGDRDDDRREARGDREEKRPNPEAIKHDDDGEEESKE